ncbi:hypothetical protein P4393_21315 [Bacillus subtilis]|uniref:hypothetical protein n=1 Tax=Bacillus subtilis TaxID=1423 RepID=UPI001EDE8B5C|nr:hypothetical protein [Bacillus subtilis]MED3441970.1 hypothetical protein [Bacillus subtilis]MED3474580.1 hypothetical protein [Bacillus subtilis]
MSDEIQVALLNGGFSIAGAAITCIVTYFAAIKGAKLQIEKMTKEAEETANKEKVHIEEAIKSLVYQEIKINIEKIPGDILKSFKERGEKIHASLHLSRSMFKFNYETFDNIKYMMLKIDDGILISDVMQVYNIFRKIDNITAVHNEKPEKMKEIYEVIEKWMEKLGIEN